MKYIYLYTTQTYQSKNWYKIGESVKNPNTRIQQQDNSSNPEPLIIVALWEVSDLVSDKKIHIQLSKLGFPRLRASREWFELSNNPVDDIESVLSGLGDFNETKISKHPKIDFVIPNVSEMWWFSNRA